MPESQKYTEARKRGNRKWDAANLDRISIAVPKGRKAEIQSHAEARSESVNGFLNRAAENQMEADKGAQMPSVAAQQPMLSPETVEAAQQAAEATGEATPDFIRRAVDTQAQRDKNALRMGINPATGETMERGNVSPPGATE